jgi:hypothetical protein
MGKDLGLKLSKFQHALQPDTENSEKNVAREGMYLISYEIIVAHVLVYGCGNCTLN